MVALEALRRVGAETELSLTVHGAQQFQTEEFCGAFDEALDREGDRIHSHGPYTRRDVATLMTAVDWVVMPSIWWENAPLTILESFRAGRPVIASDIGGMAEMVDHGVNGFLFRRNDAADLARIMKRAASEVGLWQQMVEGLPTVPTMTEITARHMGLYNDLVMQTDKRTG
jgi:glycosyltransferase involved in cell wall biosynthesis